MVDAKNLGLIISFEGKNVDLSYFTLTNSSRLFIRLMENEDVDEEECNLENALLRMAGDIK